MNWEKIGRKVSKKIHLHLIKTSHEGRREATGREISLLQMSGVRVKILKRLNKKEEG